MLKYFLIKFKHVNLQVSTPHLGVSSLLKMPWEPHTGTGHSFLQLRRGPWEMWPAPHSSTYTRSPTFLSSFFHSQLRNMERKSSCHREKKSWHQRLLNETKEFMSQRQWLWKPQSQWWQGMTCQRLEESNKDHLHCLCFCPPLGSPQKSEQQNGGEKVLTSTGFLM